MDARDRLAWCLRKPRGLGPVEPSELAARGYLRKADIALVAMDRAPDAEWRCIAAYYACYDAVYAFLQRAGLKSGIHECTIAAMPLLGFGEDDARFVEGLKRRREDAQYYVGRELEGPDAADVKRFVLVCKERYGRTRFDELIGGVRRALGEARGAGPAAV